MDRVYVDRRVVGRHPEVTEEDVAHAWFHCIRSRPRIDKDPNEYVAIGVDSRGRRIELVAKRDREGDWLIYHAQCPPQASAIRELGFSRRSGQ